MMTYTLEEMKELMANYSELSNQQKYWIMQSIRHIIANQKKARKEQNNEH